MELNCASWCVLERIGCDGHSSRQVCRTARYFGVPSSPAAARKDRLSDELDDIKQAAYQMLCKLAVREPFFVREVLDTLADPLKNVLNKKTKDNASPQDVERHNELQRSAMITVATLNKMHDSNTCHKFGPAGVRQQRHGRLYECGYGVLDATSAQYLVETLHVAREAIESVY
eukprot:768456-Hanusia_phi.AAC.7